MKTCYDGGEGGVRAVKKGTQGRGGFWLGGSGALWIGGETGTDEGVRRFTEWGGRDGGESDLEGLGEWE